jgi:hypothetical protein
MSSWENIHFSRMTPHKDVTFKICKNQYNLFSIFGDVTWGIIDVERNVLQTTYAFACASCSYARHEDKEVKAPFLHKLDNRWRRVALTFTPGRSTPAVGYLLIMAFWRRGECGGGEGARARLCIISTSDDSVAHADCQTTIIQTSIY